MTMVKVYFSGSYAAVARATEELEAEFGNSGILILDRFNGEKGLVLPDVFAGYIELHITSAAEAVELLQNMKGIQVLLVDD